MELAPGPWTPLRYGVSCTYGYTKARNAVTDDVTVAWCCVRAITAVQIGIELSYWYHSSTSEARVVAPELILFLKIFVTSK
jgi:hypothetical protein